MEELIKNPAIDQYLEEGCGRCKLGGTPACKVHLWPGVLRELRRVVLECGLTEEHKWSIPCYTDHEKNICVVSAFKNYACLSFFKGALLLDTLQILEKPGENSQSGRIIKFTSVQEVRNLEADLKAYIYEAIEAERAGLEVSFKQKDNLVYPEELIEVFRNDKTYQEAFEALTPGRKRGYILHFTQPKGSATKLSRIHKVKALVLSGKGLQGK